MSHRITKKKVKTFLNLRFRKEPLMMYDDTLDVAIEVIQDFLNCDPMDIGKLQGATYDTIYNICLLYTSPSPRDRQKSRMPSSA